MQSPAKNVKWRTWEQMMYHLIRSTLGEGLAKITNQGQTGNAGAETVIGH